MTDKAPVNTDTSPGLPRADGEQWAAEELDSTVKDAWKAGPYLARQEIGWK